MKETIKKYAGITGVITAAFFASLMWWYAAQGYNGDISVNSLIFTGVALILIDTFVLWFSATTKEVVKKSKKKGQKMKSKKGFTLIEVLLSVAIIAILSGIVIVAVNPFKQLADARNTQRRADVTTVLNAVYQYTVDNTGTIPAVITTTPTAVCATAGVCTGLIDLSILTTNEKYLTALPKDPVTGTVNSTFYNISKSANGRVTVAAPSAESGATISVTR